MLKELNRGVNDLVQLLQVVELLSNDAKIGFGVRARSVFAQESLSNAVSLISLSNFRVPHWILCW